MLKKFDENISPRRVIQALIKYCDNIRKNKNIYQKL